MNLVRARCGHDEVWAKIKGVRYLVQDKLSGLMLQPQFISSLYWLGQRGLTFDLGVDARNGGTWGLDEACEMLGLLYCNDGDRPESGGSAGIVRPKIVINHLCKPNLDSTGLISAMAMPSIRSGSAVSRAWRVFRALS